MPQKATANGVPTAAVEALSGPRLAAWELLIAGHTVTAAAAGAGVSRETLHRWLKDDVEFRASLNRARAELQQAVAARLVACSAKAAENVAAAIEKGDTKLSLVVLKGLGALGGTAPATGATDPDAMREDDKLARAEREQATSMRRLLSSAW